MKSWELKKHLVESEIEFLERTQTLREKQLFTL